MQGHVLGARALTSMQGMYSKQERGIQHAWHILGSKSGNRSMLSTCWYARGLALACRVDTWLQEEDHQA